jgi:anti-sigma regulatory factor (Ser/Thr protein kinase)
MSAMTTQDGLGNGAFRHEALLYAGPDQFVEATAAFLRDGLADDAAMLVVLRADKLDWLRDALGDDAEQIEFADMDVVGRNPARIIPAWERFVDTHGGDDRPLRGIGEPVFPSRSASELTESQLHESLLNVAFAGGRPWWLLCPYDVESLRPTVVDEARRSHPFISQDGGHWPSASYRDAGTDPEPLAGALDEPDGAVAEHPIERGGLGALRDFVRGVAARLGLAPERIEDLTLAVNEVATNSLLHGGGQGRLRCWSDGGELVCEVSDRGQILDPLAGRRPPSTSQPNGRGLWLTNGVSDLVELRSSSTGTVVRIHIRL